MFVAILGRNNLLYTAPPLIASIIANFSLSVFTAYLFPIMAQLA
jgi:hypothetical protein